MDSTIDTSLAPLVAVLATVIAIALYVWMSLALSAMFRKMGEEPWKGWVPFLNQATVLAWGGFNPWLVLLVLIPGLGALIVLVLLVISAHRINPGFGYGASMTVLAALLFVVWASILGFGPTPWRGARHSMAPPATPVPPVPTMPAAHAAAGAYSGVGTSGFAAPAPGAAGFPATSPGVFPPPAGGFPPPPSPFPSPAGAAPAFRADGGFGAGAGAGADPRAGNPGAAAPASGLSASGDERAYIAPSPSPELPEPASWAPPPPPVPSPPTPVEPDVASWPSEIDDVSAVSPSPFPPSAAAPTAARQAAQDSVGGTSGLISFVPGRRAEDDSADDPAAGRAAAVTRLPVTAPIETAAVGRQADAEGDAFPELSGEVSAVVGSPAAGAPLSARSSVAAQQRAEAAATADDDDVDETVMVRRKKVAWQLVPASASPIPLTSEVVILGRRPAADPAFPVAQLVSVRDDARTVSKTHARLELRGEKWLVTDLGSTNGVLLRTIMGEEMEIEPGTELDAGERFFLGDEEFHLQHD